MEELGLDDPKSSDESLIDFWLAHPIRTQWADRGDAAGHAPVLSRLGARRTQAAAAGPPTQLRAGALAPSGAGIGAKAPARS